MNEDRETVDEALLLAAMPGIIKMAEQAMKDIPELHRVFEQNCFCTDGKHAKALNLHYKKVGAVLQSFEQHKETLAAQVVAFHHMEEPHFQKCAKHFDHAIKELDKGINELSLAVKEMEKQL